MNIRKKLAKIVSLKTMMAFFMAFVLLLLAACGNGGTGNETTKKPDAGNQTEDGNGDTDTPDDSFSGYPMDTDVTISWYVNHGPVPNSAYGDASESPFHSGLIDMTGVTIDWRFPTAGADTNQDFNLMLNSDTLPDIIYGPVLREAERYVDELVIRDITDDIQQHAPDYYAFLQTNELYDKAMKTDGGKYIGFGFFREDGGWNDSYQGPVIRQDWLDDQNLDTPKTIDDWDNVLRVFKEEYGAVLSGPWFRLRAMGIAGAFGAFGGHNPGDYSVYVDDNGTVQLAQIQPEWKDYITKMNEWWNDGLLDQDITTNDDAAAQTKALNGATGMAYTSMGQLSNWVRDAENADNGANWVGLAHPTAADGSITAIFGGSGINNANVAFLSHDIKDENVPVALRLLDYAYTEDGFLYWNFGKEGVSWEYNADGEVEYLPLVTDDPDGLNNAIDKYGGSTWSGPNIQATRLLYLKNTEVSIEANNTWFYTHEEAGHKYKIPSGVSFTADESKERADLETPMHTHIGEAAVAFMIGERSLDEFDTFVKEIEDMQLARLLEIYQDAYDRFIAR